MHLSDPKETIMSFSGRLSNITVRSSLLNFISTILSSKLSFTVCQFDYCMIYYMMLDSGLYVPNRLGLMFILIAKLLLVHCIIFCGVKNLNFPTLWFLLTRCLSFNLQAFPITRNPNRLEANYYVCFSFSLYLSMISIGRFKGIRDRIELLLMSLSYYYPVQLPLSLGQRIAVGFFSY